MRDNPEASQPEAPMPDLPAAIRARYQVEAELGRGSMGVVYRAYDRRLDRLVALKELFPAVSRPEDRERHEARFLREARLAARLAHPNIVTVYDVLQEEGRWFIVMELLAGRSMRQILREERSVRPERAREWMCQTARALHAAHRAGIIHRDIKPENLMVQPDDQVKILDFGIALAADSPRLTRRGGTMGTPAYLAPELLRGASADGRTDLFSLGVVFYELLTGHNPYAGGPVSEVLQRISSHPPPPVRTQATAVWPDLAAVVDRLLAYDPSVRHPNAAALAFDLENTSADARSVFDALLEEPGTVAGPPGPDDPTVSGVARLKTGAAAGEAFSSSGPYDEPSLPRRGPSRPRISGRVLRAAATAAIALVTLLVVRTVTAPREPATRALSPDITATRALSPDTTATSRASSPAAPSGASIQYPPGSGAALALVQGPSEALETDSPALAAPTDAPAEKTLEALQRLAAVRACAGEPGVSSRMACLESTVPALPRDAGMPAEARKLMLQLLEQDAIRDRALALAPAVLGRKQLTTRMREWLSSPDLSHRQAAAGMLAKLGQPVPEGELRRLDLKDPSCPVRRNAALYFVRHPDPAMRADLKEAYARSIAEGVERATGVKALFKKTQRVEIEHCDHEALEQALRALDE